MFTCVRKIEFDAAHRVIGHENKCKYLHGHRYVLEIFAHQKELDNLGMVIDFGVLKQKIGGWVDEHFDHTAILSEEDKELGIFLEQYSGQKVYYLKANPTAENIAHYLLHEICPKLLKSTGVEVSKIKLYETPNCYVEVCK